MEGGSWCLVPAWVWYVHPLYYQPCPLIIFANYTQESTLLFDLCLLGGMQVPGSHHSNATTSPRWRSGLQMPSTMSRPRSRTTTSLSKSLLSNICLPTPSHRFNLYNMLSDARFNLHQDPNPRAALPIGICSPCMWHKYPEALCTPPPLPTFNNPPQIPSNVTSVNGSTPLVSSIKV